MAMLWEFFSFELRFRAKSLSTYVYFLIWLAFSFFCIASESFGPVANTNGKILLNGPWANSLQDAYALLFGIIVIAAIFGTSILRDFQRDTYQILFTKPISKFAYLGGRWAGSFVTTVFAFSGLMVGTFLGTLAPWADHARIAPNQAWWYWQPFLSIVVIQIFYIGSLFFAVAALSRKLLVVYLQGVALFILYVIGITAFSATRSLEHFWSGILDPIGLLMVDRLTRYWSVVEKNSQLLPWDFSGYSPGVFLYNRLLWTAVGVAALISVDCQVAGQAGGKGPPAGGRGVQPGAFPGGRDTAARAATFRRRDYRRPVLVSDPSAHPDHHARDSLLGHRRPAGGVRRQ
jgi:ABC-2 type transport system permease protein